MSRHIRFWAGSCSTALVVVLSATTAWGADLTCKQTLADLDATMPGVKMPAKDRESFLKDCETQARRTYRHDAEQRTTEDLARTPHTEKNEKAKIG